MKMYSAFISSAFESLRDERQMVIDALLDHKVFPICQEHFVVSANNFSSLTNYIDHSDFFVLLLGSKYGSICPEDGLSWTEKEYNYAKEKNKLILAIKCDEYKEAEKKQREFGSKIQFAMQVSRRISIERIVNRYFGSITIDENLGWVRLEPEYQRRKQELENWRNEHSRYNFGKTTWYHFHVSEDDTDYVRSGELTISQQFDPEHYTDLHIDARNISASLGENGKIVFDDLNSTNWDGDYELYINDGNTVDIKGIYSAYSRFTSKYNQETIERGERKGIHEFSLIYDSSGTTIVCFEGDFNDVAPSPKKGRILVFRSEKQRNESLLRYLKKIRR